MSVGNTVRHATSHPIRYILNRSVFRSVCIPTSPIFPPDECSALTRNTIMYIHRSTEIAPSMLWSHTYTVVTYCPFSSGRKRELHDISLFKAVKAKRVLS